ncbi:hypothetical protein SCA6_020399 [Theobroma cacao]
MKSQPTGNNPENPSPQPVQGIKRSTNQLVQKKNKKFHPLTCIYNQKPSSTVLFGDRFCLCSYDCCFFF